MYGAPLAAPSVFCLAEPTWCLLAVARIALVKPERARGMENMLIAAAQRGQITEKVRAISTASCRVSALIVCSRSESAASVVVLA
jgi:hypothetical protein